MEMRSLVVSATLAAGLLVASSPTSSADTAQTPSNPETPATSGLHGLAAVAAGTATTGPYGTQLIAGCAWATWVAQCKNLSVYGNGTSFNDVGCGPPNGCTFGSEFQCDELAQRYAFYAWGEPTQWYGYGGANGSAYSMWSAGPALPVPLEQFANGQGVAPTQGDLMIFGPGWLGGYWDGSGHVAIVEDTGPGYVDIIQQNATPTGTDRLTLNASTVSAVGYTPVTGWLHNPQSDTSRPAVAALSTGKQFVMWTGAYGHLWVSSWNAGVWDAATDLSAAWIASAPALSNPSLVVTPDDHVDAFWEGTDHHLWEGVWGGGWAAAQDVSASWGSSASVLTSSPAVGLTSDGGTYLVFWRGARGHLFEAWGAGTKWSGPVDWTSAWGSDQLVSAPSVAVAPDGTQLVFWQGPGGVLEETWFDRTWHGPANWSAAWSAAAPLSSSPSATVQKSGEQDVFWEGANGHLWEAWWAGTIQGPTDLTKAWNGLGALSSGPGAAIAGDGTRLVFWQGALGNMDEAWLNSSWHGPVEWLQLSQPRAVPTAALDSDGGRQVYWQGANNHLMQANNASSWSRPTDLTAQWPGQPLAASDPSVAATPSGQDMFWRGSNGRLVEAQLSSGKWSTPGEVTLPWSSDSLLRSAPAVSSTSSGTRIVFWEGANGHLWETWSSNGIYVGPFDRSTGWAAGAAMTSAPSVAVTPEDEQVVFWRGFNGHLWEMWWSTGTWYGPADWAAMSGGLALPQSAPAVAVTPANQQVIFWQGPSGHLWEMWFSGGWSTPVDWTASWGRGGLLTAAPSVAVRADGSQYLFWEGTDGGLWGASWSGSWLGPNGWPSLGALT